MALFETVKKKPLTSIATIVSLILSVVYFVWEFEDRIVTTNDLESAKREIINELRDESAKIRSAYLLDLEARLEDVEIQIETLSDADEQVPVQLRRKAKRLQRRIDEITNGQ